MILRDGQRYCVRVQTTYNAVSIVIFFLFVFKKFEHKVVITIMSEQVILRSCKYLLIFSHYSKLVSIYHFLSLVKTTKL